MHKLLRKLLILSAALFVIVLITYGVLYFTNFGKDGAPDAQETPDERSELNIDQALVGAYSPGLADDGSETIISLHPNGDASVTTQGPSGGGVTLGLWERVGNQVSFRFISVNGDELPSSSFSLDIQGSSLIYLDGREFKKLTEGNLLTPDSQTNTQEGPQGVAVGAAFDYVESALGGTNVEFINMTPTSTDCSDCFTVSLRYLSGGVFTTVNIRVSGGVVVR
ncbi:MAG: hypothetical protein WD883_00425 [Candidatus Colwellbacteria bacterium]